MNQLAEHKNWKAKPFNYPANTYWQCEDKELLTTTQNPFKVLAALRMKPKVPNEAREALKDLALPTWSASPSNAVCALAAHKPCTPSPPGLY